MALHPLPDAEQSPTAGDGTWIESDAVVVDAEFQCLWMLHDGYAHGVGSRVPQDVGSNSQDLWIDVSRDLLLAS